MCRCYRNAVSQCNSEFNTFNVKLSVITICPPVIFELSVPRNLLKTFCAIHRLRLWKHCYHSVSFRVVVCSSSVTCLTLDKDVMYVRCSTSSPKLKLKPLFILDKYMLNPRCLFMVHANVSNLSQIDVRFVADRFHALE